MRWASKALEYHSLQSLLTEMRDPHQHASLLQGAPPHPATPCILRSVRRHAVTCRFWKPPPEYAVPGAPEYAVPGVDQKKGGAHWLQPARGLRTSCPTSTFRNFRAARPSNVVPYKVS